MSLREYKVRVSVENQDNTYGRGYTTVANAVKYLAYADHTDTVGYHAKITEAETNKENGDYTSVDIWFEARMTDDDQARFMTELSALSRVEDWKFVRELTNPKN